jgi:hypothetical protein
VDFVTEPLACLLTMSGGSALGGSPGNREEPSIG